MQEKSVVLKHDCVFDSETFPLETLDRQLVILTQFGSPRLSNLGRNMKIFFIVLLLFVSCTLEKEESISRWCEVEWNHSVSRNTAGYTLFWINSSGKIFKKDVGYTTSIDCSLLNIGVGKNRVAIAAYNYWGIQGKKSEWIEFEVVRTDTGYLKINHQKK